MAEALARQRWPLLEISSAGLAARPGSPASPNAVQVSADRGLDLTEHRSRLLTEEMICRAQRVYTMTERHRDSLQTTLPEWEDKITTLVEESDVVDPYGGDRTEYEACFEQLEAALLKLDFELDPLILFQTWLRDAIEAGVPEANAMCLATVGREGSPSARYVLLRGCDERGFRFFSNYESRKAAELEQNPRAAAVFWWSTLKRQVRVEGSVSRLPSAESDAYFEGRARGSQLGAWASRQSRPLGERSELIKSVKELEIRFPDQVERPEFWGGYLLNPRRYEFWLGRPDRLHDRFAFELEEGSWSCRRLHP